jgi:hypothetical protein
MYPPTKSVHLDHCPFLNKTDNRCEDHFKLDQLGYALRYCFGDHKRCPVYMEMLLERRVKRLVASGKEPFDDLASRLVQVALPRPNRGASQSHHAA